MSTVTVHALSTGHLTLPERFFITPSDQEAKRTVPSLSFLIQHHLPATSQTTNILFDLGLRRSLPLYPEIVQKHCATRKPLSTTPDVVESLAQGGLTPNDIDYVILSHVHYDHIGYPKDFTNPKTKFIVGHGALDLLSGKVKHEIGSHSIFESDLLPTDRTIELPPPPTTPSAQSAESTTTIDASPLNLSKYSPLSPFPHTVPLLPHHALSIISAPGHLPGHINLLCRTSPTNFVLLAGDSYHDDRLFAGTHDIARWVDDTGKNCCIHTDVPAAKETIRLIRTASEEGVEAEVEGDTDGETKKARAKVEVVFAHDWKWEAEALTKGRFWPGRL